MATQGNGHGEDRYQAALGLFAASLSSFVDSIPETERASLDKFAESASMLEALQSQIQTNPEKSRLLRCCKKIDSFAKRWEPFFAITDIFISSHPEWAALVWGAIRLVFKLSSHYAVFFEKLADMFERIAKNLPHFGRHIVLFNRRKAQRPDVERTSALVHTLALIYGEIIKFCQEACRIFSPKDRGIRYKINHIKDLFWKPFDARFSDLLTRLTRYEQMYDLELNLADREELMAHYETFDKFVAETRRDRSDREAQSNREEVLALRRQSRMIKEWLKAPDYMAILERERLSASEEDGKWFLKSEKYQVWRQSWVRLADNNCDAATQDFQSRVLILYGPPGYGKTVLSTKIIEDLSLEEGHRGEERPLTVAFFHFDKMDPSRKEPRHAFCAVINELLHKHQNDLELVDATSILMDMEGSGQVVASETEVATILKHFLQRYPATVLLFDGIDECTDSLTFLTKLYAIFSPCHCRVLLLSRPNLAVPLGLRNISQHFYLPRDANMHEIQQFSRQALEELCQDHLLPAIDIGKAALQVARRSNSLFLWAKLMMDFLRCPSLSPNERLHAISNLNMLEGLESLYTEILNTILSKLQHERGTAFEAFHWIAVAHRPLHVSELRAGLAVRPGRQSTSELDYITDFKQSIVRICGALVEVYDDATIHFIHLSVKEFLTDLNFPLFQRSPEPWRVGSNIAHLSRATACLSYIMYDVPGTPLSGSWMIKAHLPAIDERLPLLRYSTLWAQHAIYGINGRRHPVWHQMLQRHLSIFLYTLQRFLTNQAAIMVWFESAWAFGVVLDITGLVNGLKGMLPQTDTNTDNDQPGRLVNHLEHLSKDIEYLQKEWNHVLKVQPCEIWGPSIEIFHTFSSKMRMGSGALIENVNPGIGSYEEYRPGSQPIDSLPTGGCEQELLLLTQLSVDGSRVGTISLVPGSRYLEHRAGFESRIEQPKIYLRRHCVCPDYSCVRKVSSPVTRPNGNFRGDFPPNNNNSQQQPYAKDDNGNIRGSELDDSEDSDSEEDYAADRDDDDDEDISYLEWGGKIAMATSTCLSLCVGWQVRIQIRPLAPQPDSSTGSTEVLVNVPQWQINQMLTLSIYHGVLDSFIVPAAFRPDLQVIVCLRCIIHLNADRFIARQINNNGFPEEIGHGINDENPSYSLPTRTLVMRLINPAWYKVVFSHHGKYFAIIHSKIDSCYFDPFEDYECILGDFPLFYDCSITIFEESATRVVGGNQGVREYARIATCDVEECIGFNNAPIVFHPSQPYIVITNHAHIRLWKFDEDCSQSRILCDGLVQNLSFSKDGRILRGDLDGEPFWFMIDYKGKRRCSTKGASSNHSRGRRSDRTDDEILDGGDADENQEDDDLETYENTVDWTGSPLQSHELDLSPTTPESRWSFQVDNQLGWLASNVPSAPMVQSSQDSGLHSLQGGPNRSLVIHDSTNGAVLIETLNDDGTSRTAELLRLPQSVLSEKSYTTIINDPSRDSSSL